jgi:dihydropteroate synthase
MSRISIMGILNATPDSFFEGSRIVNQKAVDVAGRMLEDGADILDIGGQSTRPGAKIVSAEEEADRILPVIENIVRCFPSVVISADTFYGSVAKQAVATGAGMINDISAGEDDPEMLPFIAACKVPYVAMHKQGKPQNMQDNPVYQNVTTDILGYFEKKQNLFQSMGIDNWIIDPGFGFGKTVSHNFELLGNLAKFKALGKPLLVGISRKSMIWKTLQTSANEALNGTTALHMAALIHGANILRVHDVKEARECVNLFEALYGK